MRKIVKEELATALGSFIKYIIEELEVDENYTEEQAEAYKDGCIDGAINFLKMLESIGEEDGRKKNVRKNYN